jgi:hypothetical protein
MNDAAKKLIKFSKKNDMTDDEFIDAIEQLYVRQVEFMLAKNEQEEFENIFIGKVSRITINATRELLNYD